MYNFFARYFTRNYVSASQRIAEKLGAKKFSGSARLFNPSLKPGEVMEKDVLSNKNYLKNTTSTMDSSTVRDNSLGLKRSEKHKQGW